MTARPVRDVLGRPRLVAPRRCDDGIVSLTLPLLLWLATVVTVVVIDIGGYLVAASRAQTLADHAALAAVSASVVGAAGGGPTSEATTLAVRGGGRLESCECAPRSEVAHVTVSVPVPGLVVPRLGAGRVAADASAVLAPPDDLPPGPTRERARWSRPPP
jgi:hypothetical protein